MSLCLTIGKTFQIFGSNLSVFLALSLTVHVPLCVNTVCFLLSSSLGKDSEPDYWKYVSDHVLSSVSYIALQGLLSVILAFSVQGAMVRAAAEIFGTLVEVNNDGTVETIPLYYTENPHSSTQTLFFLLSL
jgi:hypothetical protein